MLKKKYFMLLLSLLFVLLLGAFSTSYAWTFDQFQEFCTMIKDGKISANANQKESATYFLNNVNRIKNQWSDWEEYTNFIVVNDSYLCFEMYKGNATLQTYGVLRVQNATAVRRCRLYSSSIGDTGTTSNINSYSWGAQYSIGLMQNTRSDGIWGNKFAWLLPIENPNYYEIPLPLLIAQAYTRGKL